MESTEDRVFRCRRCGACCRWPGYVLLTAADITRLARRLAMLETEFIQRYTRLAANRGQLALQDAAGHACIFLESETCCQVYAARPGQCRQFPGQWDVPGGCPGRSVPDTARLEPCRGSC